MKKITKKEMSIFVNDATDLIKCFGAVKSNYYLSGGYDINTELGVFHVKIENEHSSVFTIFGRFEDVEKASKMINCNPYTGKWNIHEFNRETAIRKLEVMLERFAHELELMF